MKQAKPKTPLPDYRHELVTINIGLARSAANNWVRRTGRKDLYEDVLQECITKLIEAAAGFATPLGLRFSTYAVTAMNRGIFTIMEKVERGDRLRNHKRELSADGWEESIPDDEYDHFREANTAEQINAVMVYISPEDRRTLEDLYLRELPSAVVAWRKGVSSQAVQQKRAHTIRRVRKLIATLNQEI